MLKAFYTLPKIQKHLPGSTSFIIYTKPHTE